MKEVRRKTGKRDKKQEIRYKNQGTRNKKRKTRNEKQELRHKKQGTRNKQR